MALGGAIDNEQGEVLRLISFGVAYGERIVLSSVDLGVPSRGIVTLMGPAGTGKSTLLRTIARFNNAVPALRTWGECTYEGRPLSDENSPVLVGQNSRLLTASLLANVLQETPERFASTADEKAGRAMQILARVGLEDLEGQLHRSVVELPLVTQRLVAIARTLPRNPALLCIDEPTYGLAEDDAQRILSVARQEAEHRAVMLALHNQRQARQLQGRVALLAGGVIQEYRAAGEFFRNPETVAGREFRDTGSCSEPSPDAREEDLATGVRPRLRRPPAECEVPSEAVGPRGFTWLLPGRLGGTPRPGVVADTEYDLRALKRVGVSTLISLTMRPLDEALLRRMEMRSHWYPVPDMGAPTLQEARLICLQIGKSLRGGEVVAVHCRAGLGRTGTILAAYLVWSGRSAMSALEEVRRLEPKWVQSEAQVAFLEEFARELAHRGRDAACTEACGA